MIIVYIMGGLGNQLFQYAAGRRLAHKLGVELKLDISWFIEEKAAPYQLSKFNIVESIATPEEIRRVHEINNRRSQPLGWEREPRKGFLRDFMPEVLDYPDDVYLYGYFQSDKYFNDISDIIRNEFTLKINTGGGAEYQFGMGRENPRIRLRRRTPYPPWRLRNRQKHANTSEFGADRLLL